MTTAYAVLVAAAGHFLSGIATGSILLCLILEERGHTFGALIAKVVESAEKRSTTLKLEGGCR